MTKEEILNYVMDTPNNTNRMVLGDMIDELVNSSSSGGLLSHGTVVATIWIKHGKKFMMLWCLEAQ